MHQLVFLSWCTATTALGTIVGNAPAAATVATGQAEGCGETHLFNGITQYHDLTSSGRERQYSIHLPGDYDKTNPYPVVLGFHGSESVGFFFEVDTKMSESRFSSDV